MSLLAMSLRGGVFIAAVALVRLLLRRVIPRRVCLLLWLAALALLLIPLRLPTPFSVYNLLQPQQASASGALSAVPQLPQLSGTVPTEARAADPRWLIYWVGVIACSLTLAGLHLRNLLRCRRAEAISTDVLALPRRVRLRAVEHLSSPLCCGLFRPVILLPRSYLLPGAPSLRHVLTHELCHLRARDPLKKLILLLAAVVHWFNPLVWLMVFLAGQDLEMCCDAAAIRMLGEDERLRYAETLVAAEEHKLAGLLLPGFSYSATGSRLKQLRPFAVSPAVTIPLSALVCVLLLGFFATGSVPAAAAAQLPAAQLDAAVLPTQPAPEAACSAPAALPQPTQAANALLPPSAAKPTDGGAGVPTPSEPSEASAAQSSTSAETTAKQPAPVGSGASSAGLPPAENGIGGAAADSDAPTNPSAAAGLVWDGIPAGAAQSLIPPVLEEEQPQTPSALEPGAWPPGIFDGATANADATKLP